MTDLTDRMRTCAAYLCGAEKAGDGGLRDFGRAIIDAADLLIEASNMIESYQPHPVPVDERGEPMEIIEPSHTPIPPTIDRQPSGTWVAIGDTLPVARLRPPRACPRCDSRSTKTARRVDNKLMLICPVCAHEWPYVRNP